MKTPHEHLLLKERAAVIKTVLTLEGERATLNIIEELEEDLAAQRDSYAKLVTQYSKVTREVYDVYYQTFPLSDAWADPSPALYRLAQHYKAMREENEALKKQLADQGGQA